MACNLQKLEIKFSFTADNYLFNHYQFGSKAVSTLQFYLGLFSGHAFFTRILTPT